MLTASGSGPNERRRGAAPCGLGHRPSTNRGAIRIATSNYKNAS